MKNAIANITNKCLRTFGYEIKATALLPKQNLLGIKNTFNIHTIIDAGANLGQFALWARAEFPNATLHSFEPVRATFEKLQVTARMDPLWNTYNLGLSSEKSVRKINLHVDHPSSSSLLDSTPLEVDLYPSTSRKVKRDVTCTTLDKWVEEYKPKMDKDILLKMDVQGHEASVLQGGKHVLQNVQVVIAEAIIEQLYHSQTTFPELVALLDSSGFNFIGVMEHGFSARGNVVALDAVFFKRSQVSHSLRLLR